MLKIPLSGNMAFFSYFNPLRCVDQQMLMSGYNALNFYTELNGGIPVDGIDMADICTYIVCSNACCDI